MRDGAIEASQPGLVERVAEHIKSRFLAESSGHDWHHINRVWKLARQIAEAEGANREIAELGALVHDIADWKFHGGDDSVGPREAERLLREEGAAPEVIEQVEHLSAGLLQLAMGGTAVGTGLNSPQGFGDEVAKVILAYIKGKGIPHTIPFTVDADGLLSVSAREQGSGVEAQIAVKPSYGLGDDQIARMLQESFTTAEADMQARAVTEARVDADRMMLATVSALNADGDLLEGAQRADIDRLMQDVQAARTLEDAKAIEAITLALAHGTEAFAALRMNRGIRQALAGKNIATI